MKKKGISVRPFLHALYISLSCYVFCIIYIILSSFFAAQLSKTLLDLRFLEVMKGLVFVSIISLFLFITIFCFLKKIAKKESEIRVHQKALLISERRAMAGIMAASTAHDMNNSLTSLLLYSDDLYACEKTSKFKEEDVACIINEINNLKNLAHGLVNIAKIGIPGNFEIFSLIDIVHDAIEISRRHIKVKSCDLTLDINTDQIAMFGNPNIIHQMLINLIINAADAVQHTGMIKVVIQKVNSEVVLSVHDNGPGIPVEKRKSIFKAFYTTKEGGSGLGLLSVKACVKLHKGSMKIEDSELGGACFVVTLPLHTK